MQRYRDIDRDSGVSEYEIGDDFIRVKFGDGAIYRYTGSSVGGYHLEQMKCLANQGDGLNSYIMKNVKKRYERKER